MHKTGIFDIGNGFHYGMHALGEAKGVIFANCREGLETWYDRGIRVFEVDVNSADDGEYVACHSFNKEGLEEQGITNVPEFCTSEWYLSQKLYKDNSSGLTPISLKEILDFIGDKGDAVLMIDFKRTDFESTVGIWSYLNQFVNNGIIFGEQIVFEIYDQNMLAATKTIKSDIRLVFNIEDDIEVGDSYKIRCMPLNQIIDWMNSNYIHIVSFPWKKAVENLPKLKSLKDAGFTIISRTRNDIFSDLLERCGINVNLVSYRCTMEQKQFLSNYRCEYIKKFEKKISLAFRNC